MCTRAVLVLIYNRLETAEKVLRKVVESKPDLIFIHADGPNPDKPSDEEKCLEVRKMAQRVTQGQPTVNLWQPTNLGLRKSVPLAINWAFQTVDQLIILEDDCLPSDSAFKFLFEMLDRYREVEEIMHISAYNVQGSWGSESNDYFFSNTGGVWGWATWKHSWEAFDENLPGLEEKIRSRFFRNLLGRRLGKLREKQFLEYKFKASSGWDYAWAFARNALGGLAVVPRVSLVENLGFDVHATNTKSSTSVKNNSRNELFPPYKPPRGFRPDRNYDNRFFPSKLIRVLRKMGGTWTRFTKVLLRLSSARSLEE